MVIDFLTENLRQPAETLGDIRAQFAAYRECNAKLKALMDEEALVDLSPVADEIISRSDISMRSAIASLPDGTYRDGFDVDGVDQPLRIACSVVIEGERLMVDFTGTSPQVPWPINSVLNYTQAYARYAVKCLVDPSAPNNAGSLAPIDVTAPAGCLLNATPPAPVWGRHLSGHYVPPAIFGALAPIILEDFVLANVKSFKILPDSKFIARNILVAKNIDIENYGDDAFAWRRNDCLVDQNLSAQILLMDTKLHKKACQLLR